jgi:hypothetical protein
LKKSKVGAMCLIAVFTFVSLRQDSRDKLQQREDAKTLEGEVEAANTAQKNNTGLFIQNYKDLSGQVADLKTQVATKDLQRKLASVETQLEATQKALIGPKATLAFTFWPFTNPPLGSGLPPTLSLDKTLPVNTDGSVHIEFTILNLTDVNALDGDITLQICDHCTYATEPPEFGKLAGDEDTERIFSFQRISAKAFNHEMSVDVIPPPLIQTFDIGIQYRCRTCIVPQALSKGTVRLQRDFLKLYK